MQNPQNYLIHVAGELRTLATELEQMSNGTMRAARLDEIARWSLQPIANILKDFSYELKKEVIRDAI